MHIKSNLSHGMNQWKIMDLRQIKKLVTQALGKQSKYFGECIKWRTNKCDGAPDETMIENIISSEILKLSNNVSSNNVWNQLLQVKHVSNYKSPIEFDNISEQIIDIISLKDSGILRENLGKTINSNDTHVKILK